MERSPKPPQIASIVIPADDKKPLHRQRIDAPISHPGGYCELHNESRWFGYALGSIVTRAALYVDEGLYLRPPVNNRATLLLQAHCRPMRDIVKYLSGDVFLTGMSSNRGADIDVPNDLARPLLGKGRPFHLELCSVSDEWQRVEQPFNDWMSAYKYAVDLGRQGADVWDVRLVPKR